MPARSKTLIRTSGFALGLAGAIAINLLTWQSPNPVVANNNDYSSYDEYVEYPDTALSLDAINVFGDSLVDSGNFFDLTSAFSEAGVPALPPSPPYAQKFSNGPVWVETLAQELGFSIKSKSVLSKTDSLGVDKSVNFAVAGALSSDVNLSDSDIPALADSLPGFQEQVSEFVSLSNALGSKAQLLQSNALTIVAVGSNDYIAAVGSPDSLGELSIDALPNIVTDNIISGIEQLSTTGAENFLVVNIPLLGEAPLADFFGAQSGQDISSTLNQLSVAHNEQLSQKLDILSTNNPNINIVLLDIGTLFSQISARRSEFMLENVTEACLTNFQPGFQFEGICENPDRFAFWDDVHPTAAAHRIISDFAIAALQAEK